MPPPIIDNATGSGIIKLPMESIGIKATSPKPTHIVFTKSQILNMENSDAA